jgi:hypothetical protein
MKQDTPINELSDKSLKKLGFEKYYHRWINGNVIIESDGENREVYVANAVAASGTDYDQKARGVETAGDLITLCSLINGKPEK